MIHDGNKHRARPCSGVGMVEVLVALVVLSVGMLGTATLYVTSMQAKVSALSRMQAVNLAADIADKIRANRNATNYGLTTTTAALTAPTVTCTTANCTAAQVATMDLYLWSTAVLTTLPAASCSITFTAATSTAPALYVIQLGWTEPSVGNLTHTLRVQI